MNLGDDLIEELDVPRKDANRGRSHHPWHAPYDRSGRKERQTLLERRFDTEMFLAVAKLRDGTAGKTLLGIRNE